MKFKYGIWMEGPFFCLWVIVTRLSYLVLFAFSLLDVASRKRIIGEGDMRLNFNDCCPSLLYYQYIYLVDMELNFTDFCCSLQSYIYLYLVELHDLFRYSILPYIMIPLIWSLVWCELYLVEFHDLFRNSAFSFDLLHIW